MPDSLRNKDEKTEEFKIIVSIVILHSINYTPFLTTLIMYPLIYLLSAYFMLKKQIETRLDPYTGEPLADDTEYTSYMLANYCVIVFITIVHQYLIQRDLLIITIVKHTLAR